MPQLSRCAAGARDRDARADGEHHQRHDRVVDLPDAGDGRRAPGRRGADRLSRVRHADDADRAVLCGCRQPCVADRRALRVHRHRVRRVRRFSRRVSVFGDRVPVGRVGRRGVCRNCGSALAGVRERVRSRPAPGGAVRGAGRGERARHQTGHPSGRSHHGREADSRCCFSWSQASGR